MHIYIYNIYICQSAKWYKCICLKHAQYRHTHIYVYSIMCVWESAMCALLWVHLKRAQFSITATAHYRSRWEQHGTTISQASGIFQHTSSSSGSLGTFSSMIYLWEMDIFIYFPVRYVQLPERMRIIKVTNQFSYGAPHS